MTLCDETDLDKLLCSMEPVLVPGECVFCTVRGGCPAGIAPIGTFHEAEGLTLIVRRTETEQAGMDYSFPCRMITLNVHSSLAAVGFLAAVAARLAEGGISMNAVSAFYHDHLFVPVDRAEEAMVILEGFQGRS